LAALAAGSAAGCGGGDPTYSDLKQRWVKLPNGQRIRAELATTKTELQRGMKYRESLPVGQGMLFVYGRMGQYPHWMYQVKMPLDVIWMDNDKRIVQMAVGMKPCPPGPPESCPGFGGSYMAAYALEVPAGQAEKNGLAPGMKLEFEY
jgi:hypothetical protein